MSLADALGLSGAKALARSVGGEKLRVLTLDDATARALEKAGHVSLLARVADGRIECDERAADVLCLAGRPDDPALLRECARAVKRGGRVLLATGINAARKERPLVTAVFMHAGLVEIEQHWSRGILVTTGRVR